MSAPLDILTQMQDQSTSQTGWNWPLADSNSSEPPSEPLLSLKVVHEITKNFTTAVAMLNRDFFYQRLQSRVQNRLPYLHVIEPDSSPLVDSLGRTTYFYVKIGKKNQI